IDWPILISASVFLPHAAISVRLANAAILSAVVTSDVGFDMSPPVSSGLLSLTLPHSTTRSPGPGAIIVGCTTTACSPLDLVGQVKSWNGPGTGTRQFFDDGVLVDALGRDAERVARRIQAGDRARNRYCTTTAWVHCAMWLDVLTSWNG